jgi:YD repeat-containing protein
LVYNKAEIEFMSRIKMFKKIATIFPLLFALHTYGQGVDVDPLTGAPSISIPLYTLNYGKISVPINLVHSSTSLGVMDGEGDAGFGWNLSCRGYGVFRQVRGLPDNPHVVTGGAIVSGVPAFTPAGGDDYTNYSTGEQSDYNTLNNWGYTVDTEPDLFVVSAPGIYAQFVFDNNGIPRMLNQQDISITASIPVFPTDHIVFTVKNNTGLSYVFNTPDTVSRLATYKKSTVDVFTTDYNYYHKSDYDVFYGASTKFIGAWYLTFIHDENNNRVFFNYKKNGGTASADWRTRINSSNVSDSLYYVSDFHNPLYLDSINAGNYKVRMGGGPTVYSVNVSEKESGDLLNYVFKYQLVKSGIDTKDGLSRHFLTDLLPFDSKNCVAQVPYKFSYQGVTQQASGFAVTTLEMPWKSLKSQDVWGGYNGDASNNNTPQIYFYSGQTDNRRLSLKPISGSTLTQTLTGSTRNVMASKVGNGSLTKITYPTGGTVQLVWERNKYFDSSTGQVLFGPGLRIASLITSGGEAAFGRNASASNPYHQIRKDYTYTKADNDTTTSGLSLYPPAFAFATGGASGIIRTPNNLYSGSSILYSRVKEKVSAQGATVYEYALPAMYPSTSYSTDWMATRSHIARASATSLTNIKNGYYTFPFAPNPNYDFERGLLTRQSQYSETNDLVRETKYQYTRINPALQSLYGVKFEKLPDCNCFHFAKYQIITGTTKVLTQKISKEVSETNSLDTTKVVTVYHYNNDVVNNNFLMDSIRTIYGDGSVARTKIKYVKDFAAITNPTASDVMADAIKKMIAASRHGEVVEQFSSFKPIGGIETITGSSLNLFKDFGNGRPGLYQTYSLPRGAAFTPASVITGSTQGFLQDTDYKLVNTINDYDGIGNAVSITDNKKNKLAYHFSQNQSFGPLATFANTTAKQTVYDGFEFYTGRGLSGSVISTAIAKTGTKSASLTASGLMYQSYIENAAKPYRVSLWANGTANSTITVKFVDPNNANALVTSTTLSYNSLNQWAYLEGVLNVTSSTPAILRLEITSNATITVDDVLILPKDATVSTQTYLPLKGITSQTDDRGNSTTATYDALGRKVATFDRQGNMVERYDYQFKGAVPKVMKSNFGIDYSPNQTIIAGNSFNVYYDVDQCNTSLAYEWTVDGVLAGTSNPLPLTISSPGGHNVQLKVTNTVTGDYGVSSQNLCVQAPEPVEPTFNMTSTSTQQYSCDPNPAPIKFTISNIVAQACGTASTVSYKWSVSFDGTNFTDQPDYDNMTVFFANYPTAHGFAVKATVINTCMSNDPLCPGSVSSSWTNEIVIGWVDQGACH